MKSCERMSKENPASTENRSQLRTGLERFLKMVPEELLSSFSEAEVREWRDPALMDG
ncbi:hypothetical protein D3C74_114120 [compost metagenome]